MKMFRKLTPSWSDDAEGKMQAAANAIFDLLAEVKHLRAANEILKIAHARYEYVRRLSPRAFADLYQANINGEGAFDDLVDQWIKADISQALNDDP